MKNLGKTYFWITLLPIIFSLLITFIILFFFKALPAKLPLFYSLAWGDKQLATHEEFLIIPAGIILITFINIVISSQLHPSQVFFKRVLLATPLVISLILIVTFVKIILIFI